MTGSAVDRRIPELVPARMLNEFAYCQRLFFLEWVQARFADNVDTVEGRFVHRAVDRGGGAVGDPGDPNPVVNARSVLVSSDRLGLIARADLLEGNGGSVRPVEVKRGRPPQHGPAWEPELVQLCAIGMILEDNGYRCVDGEVYFAETRERRTVTFDEALRRRTLELLEQLQQVAAADQAPPPLVDSPKCPRCSLVGICLPDEVNLLTGRSEQRPRRLVPRDDARRPLYVVEQGAYVGVSGDRLVISKQREELTSVRVIDVSQVALLGNVQVSAQAMRRCFDEEIPVLWFTYGGWFSGVATGLPSKHVDLRIRQVAAATRGALSVARRMVEGKIRNSRVLLRRNSRGDVRAAVAQLGELAASAQTADDTASLLGIEGAAARIYFANFSSMLRDEGIGPFDFQKRNRRPPLDPINALLSFTYALLVKDLVPTIIAVGLDPYLGLYHRPRFGRPALALDLAEEFRPLIAESVVLQVVNNGEVTMSDFVTRAQGVSLTSAGRRAVIAAYERRLDHEVTHPKFGYRITYRRVLEVQVRILAAHLLGELDHYEAMVPR